MKGALYGITLEMHMVVLPANSEPAVGFFSYVSLKQYTDREWSLNNETLGIDMWRVEVSDCKARNLLQVLMKDIVADFLVLNLYSF